MDEEGVESLGFKTAFVIKISLHLYLSSGVRNLRVWVIACLEKDGQQPMDQ